eukprot:641655-Pleurochrysis_carterae.AAC.2
MNWTQSGARARKGASVEGRPLQQQAPEDLRGAFRRKKRSRQAYHNRGLAREVRARQIKAAKKESERNARSCIQALRRSRRIHGVSHCECRVRDEGTCALFEKAAAYTARRPQQREPQTDRAPPSARKERNALIGTHLPRESGWSWRSRRRRPRARRPPSPPRRSAMTPWPCARAATRKRQSVRRWAREARRAAPRRRRTRWRAARRGRASTPPRAAAAPNARATKHKRRGMHAAERGSGTATADSSEKKDMSQVQQEWNFPGAQSLPRVLSDLPGTCHSLIVSPPRMNWRGASITECWMGEKA